MKEFFVGNRVCVRPSARPRLAGRLGTVVVVKRKSPGGPVLTYQVQLDAVPSRGLTATHAYFGPNDLEPAPDD